jgi:hypothetical protein
VLQGDSDDRVTEEIESGALAPTVGQAPRPRLRGAKRGTQVAWKERRARGSRLSGADRRRTDDQLRSERRARRRDPSLASVHTFHSRILRSIADFNNGTYGPTVDQLPERRF